MRWNSVFLWAFRRVCRDGDEVDFWGFAGVPAGVRPVVLGGLCTSFIRRAYLHTTSSVLVRRATLGVGNLGLCVCLPLKGKRDETTLPMEVTNDEDENDEN
jgi:hypothetical protein